MKKVLITGASGFVGSHLVELLSSGEYQLFGTVFGSTNELKGVGTYSLDLTDKAATEQVIKEILPDWVFHLAALSSPAASFNDNNATLINNVVAQTNLLDALVKYAPHARVLIVGSAEEYGKVDPSNLPIDESCPMRPISPYAVSKITQDFMGLQYYLSYGLECIRVRPFNHVGERQAPAFVLSAFARQIALIEAGQQEPVMLVGNLSATRDFTDVKDMVKAYELALIKGLPGEVYNLGSEKEVVIADLLQMLLKQARVAIDIKQDPGKIKQADVPRLRANCRKFRQLTGWQAKIPLEETIERVLDYWRGQVDHEITKSKF